MKILIKENIINDPYYEDTNKGEHNQRYPIKVTTSYYILWGNTNESIAICIGK